MKRVYLLRFALLVVLLALLLPAGRGPVLAAPAAAPAEPGGGVSPPAGGGTESIGGSYVYLNGVVSPDTCFRTGQVQTFCFQAISYTDDNDYVYYLWQRFPDDWTVSDVYVYDTPYCVNGGTFGPFSWSTTLPNEVRILHVRYQANPSDTCTAYYCFQVTSGGPTPLAAYAMVSWYWVSSVYGSPPYYPCSSDVYTPAGQPACDEATVPPVIIDRCTSKVYLPVVFRNW